MRRVLAACLSAGFIATASVVAIAPEARAAAVFEIVDAEPGTSRMVYDISDDGRFVLTALSSFFGRQTRVVDRETGTFLDLPRFAHTARLISGDGRFVAYTADTFVAAERRTRTDVHLLRLSDLSTRVMTTGFPGWDFSPIAIDRTGSTILAIGSSMAAFRDSAVLADGVDTTEIRDPQLAPTGVDPLDMSADGRWSVVRHRTTCGGPSCPYAVYRYDRTDGSFDLITYQDGLFDPSSLMARISGDGRCVVANFTLPDRSTIRDCGAGPIDLGIAAPADYRQACRTTSISHDGATIAFLAATPSANTFDSTLFPQPQVFVTDGIGEPVIVSAQAGDVPFGRMRCVALANRGLIVFSGDGDRLLPGGGTDERVLVRADIAAPPPPAASAAEGMVVDKQGGALILTQRCGVFGRLPSTTDVDAGEFAELAEVVPARDAPVATNGSQSCAIELGAAKLVDRGSREGLFYVATGRINQLTVTDTRSSNQAWTVSGSVTRFTNGNTGADDSFSGSFLGWRPVVTHTSDASQQVNPGPVVDPSPTDGLGSPKVLASAPNGRAIGVARLDARLKLLIPATVSDGRFTATLTFTVI